MEKRFQHASANIRMLLAFHGWTQATLAKKTGVSLPTLKRKLKTNTGWTLLEATTIACIFNKTVEEVFFTALVPSGTGGVA